LSDHTYTAEEVDAAVEALLEPDRFRHAQEVVTHAAPGLQQVLNAALAEGGWFGSAHEEQVGRAVSTEDPEERSKAVRTLLADETRLGLLVGVAVGFELASELASARAQAGTPDTQPTDLPPTPIYKES
jgi:hypothetical protein